MKEVRVYLINLHDCRVKDMDNILELTDEEFMFEAEEQGKVYSLKGFQKAFNLEEVNIATDQMRIIEVETYSPSWEFDKTKPIVHLDNPLDNHIKTMASMIKNLTNPKNK